MATDDGKRKRGWGIVPNTLAVFIVVTAPSYGMWFNDTIRLFLGR